MLRLEGVEAGHPGAGLTLRGVDLTVAPGEILCLAGRNGAGKTTTLKAIMGLVRVSAGRVLFDGQDITSLDATRVPGLGIGLVPQGRRLFPDMSVAENIEIGLLARGPAASGQARAARERVLALFPRLRERLGQRAGTLSGGEQQMLAIGRALALSPRLLLMDEPTEGLQPSMVALIRDVTARLRAEGVGVLLVEQRVRAVLPAVDKVAFLVNGRVAQVVEAASLAADPAPLAAHVGV